MHVANLPRSHGQHAVEGKVHTEAAAVLGERAPTLADLPALAYTTMTIEETLRLYPPVWLFGRRAITEDVIGGYGIPAGGALFLCPYLAHRDPRFWDNPEGFDPDRFTPEAVAARSRFAHFPFALGPRMCIGASFALMEMQIVVAMVARRYRLHLLPARRVEPDPQITLRPKNGMPMTLHPRTAAAGPMPEAGRLAYAIPND